MTLYRFQFPAYIAGAEPHWSRSILATDEQAFRAIVADLFPSIPVLAVREATPFERAEYAVSELYDGRMRGSECQGMSALDMLARIFGGRSAEYVAYRAFLADLSKQEDAADRRHEQEQLAAMERACARSSYASQGDL